MKELFKKYIPDDAKVSYDTKTAIFEVSAADIREVVSNLLKKHLSLKLIDATDERADDGGFRVWYVFGVPGDDLFVMPFICLDDGDTLPSLAGITVAALNYERKIQEFFGIKLTGHPNPQRLLLHENWPDDAFPLRKDFNWNKRPKTATGTYKFQSVKSEGIYEIPVGPIHAGIIEPGHFRFSVAGESIMLLEARLGFVHKGTEKLFEGQTLEKMVKLSEKISGDSSFSHSLAFCQAIEQLAGIVVPERAKYLRTIYAELERLANHVGDIGFMMLDTGFNFGGSQGARLREMVMRINDRLTGSRFLRGVNSIGGVTQDISGDVATGLAKELDDLLKDFSELIEIAEDSAALLNRLKGTGPLPHHIAKDYGALGVPARAVGIATDARAEHPYAAYDQLSLGPIATAESGDVYARFSVRVQEVRSAVKIIQQAIESVPDGPIRAKVPAAIELKPNAVALGIVEGWRGEIVHFIRTDSDGQINRVAVRDPSFINWQVVGYCGANQVVPDFPLINKSFNLSYTGHDL
ncbi:MAG TPA: NADH-quinone oxidoreductase subunit C [Patescibacteria group bacterium]|jgi:Ni,Fe-hydrogenase III large subunit/Ni,Fe-hydrogenase III component G|nr:NADH-quinone oxidoreductase subunit C [Patescibacteria group bacterium]